MCVRSDATMSAMSQDKSNPLAPVGGGEKMSPADRVKLAQQMMERQQDTQQLPLTVATPVTPGSPAATVADPAHQVSNAFDVNAVTAANAINAVTNVANDTVGYGAAQKPDDALFAPGATSGAVDIKGPIWKKIPFGPPQTAALLDTKRPIENYNVQLPQGGVRIKQGQLFQLTATPTNGTEPTIKKAVLVDDNGKLKGIELKSAKHFERALREIPDFVANLFASAFKGDTSRDNPLTHHRVGPVTESTNGAYEVKLGRKNEVDGKWNEVTVPVNNFGMKIRPGGDPRLQDIHPSQYYLDRFTAS